MVERALSDILDPSYVENLGSLPPEELRRRKEQADAHEAALSYARRILQGKIDLLIAELQGRKHSSEPDLAPLMADLAKALEPRRERQFRGRFPKIIARPETPEVAEAERIAADPIFTRIEEASADEIAWIAGRLRDAERRISDMRNKLHGQIDALEAEMVRRYSSGQLSVDEVLEKYVREKP